MGSLGDDGAAANLDVSHVDDPGPFIPTNSTPGDGWIAAKVKARKGSIHGKARHDVANERVVATIEIPVAAHIVGPISRPTTRADD